MMIIEFNLGPVAYVPYDFRENIEKPGYFHFNKM